MAEMYYEVILPENAGRAIVIQEFGPVIGVGYLHFGDDVMDEVKALGGYQEGAHYGPDHIHDQYCSVAQGSWLFPVEHKDAVIALTHRVINKVEERYKKRGRPAQDKVTRAFTLDRDLAAEIDKLDEGQRSPTVNVKLREAFGLPSRNHETH